MADDVVHLPTVPIQAGPGSLVFLLTGQFLLPPRAVVYSVQRPTGIQPPAFLLKLRIVRLQDTAADVVAAGPVLCGEIECKRLITGHQKGAGTSSEVPGEFRRY